VLRSATFSPDRTYRYRLLRRWSRGRRILWVMLNPSTADAQRDDPTIRRCIAFSRDWGYGSMEVVNLYALRATRPAALRRHPDPVGPENERHVRAATRRADLVVAAWGVLGAGRDASMALGRRGRVVCLGLTRAGAPRHPLYVPASAVPAPFELDQVQPAAKRLRKQRKSSTLSTGGVVEASQLANGSPAAKRLRKHRKSSTFRTGPVVDASQLG